MTDRPEQDARAAFLADQEAAVEEATTRDQQVWDLEVSSRRHDLEVKRSHTARTDAQASLLNALAVTLYVLILAGAVYALGAGILAAVGVFR